MGQHPAMDTLGPTRTHWFPGYTKPDGAAKLAVPNHRIPRGCLRSRTLRFAGSAGRGTLVTSDRAARSCCTLVSLHQMPGRTLGACTLTYSGASMRGLDGIQQADARRADSRLTAHLHLAILRQEWLEIVWKRRIRPLIPERRLHADNQALR